MLEELTNFLHFELGKLMGWQSHESRHWFGGRLAQLQEGATAPLDPLGCLEKQFLHFELRRRPPRMSRKANDADGFGGAKISKTKINNLCVWARQVLMTDAK